MTENEFIKEGEKLFNANSVTAYMSGSRSITPDQLKTFLKSVYGMQLTEIKVGLKEKLVNELVRKVFDSEQDRVDFIFAFLA